MASANSIYNKVIGPFRGVDFSSNDKDVAEYRMAYAVNLYRNYDAEGGASVETIPGFRKLHGFEDKVNGIHRFKQETTEYIFVHVGTSLYQFEHGERDNIPNDAFFTGIANAKSTSFQFNNKFYLLDGTNMWCWDEENASFLAYGSEQSTSAYVPQVYLNGELYEQRNMLTNEIKERYILPATETAILAAYPCEGDGLMLPFHEIHEEATGDDIKVLVNGQSIGNAPSSRVSITRILTKEGIESQASVTHLFDEPGSGTYTKTVASLFVKRTGETYSFRMSPNNDDSIPEGTSGTASQKLLKINVPVGQTYRLDLPEIPEGCFISAMGGSFVGIKWYISGSVVESNYDAYESTEDDNYLIPATTVTLYAGEHIVCLKLYWVAQNDRPDSLQGDLKLNAHNGLYWNLADGNYGIEFNPGEDLNPALLGSTIDIYYTAEPSKFATAKDYTNFLEDNPNYAGTTVDAIAKCTLCAVFDGRVFLSGNPALPNTVFYCQRDNTGYANASYWGIYNYWNEGVEESPIVSLLPTASMLMVFKGDTVQDGSVYYRQGVSLEDDITPRVYTGTSGVAGIGCIGATCNFFDDPVFLSKRGMGAIGKQTVNLERTMEHRSSNVDAKLVQEDLANAIMVEWKGYLLVVCPSGHVYMADSRATFTHSTGVVQYEWFYLEGIGEYKDAAKAYRYASYLPSELAELGYSLLTGYEGEMVEKPPTVTNVSVGGTSVPVYHDGAKHLVEWAGEYLPGKLSGTEYADTTFHGATCALAVDDVLYFATKNGGLFCFNNDYVGEQAYMSLKSDVTSLYAVRQSVSEDWATIGAKPASNELARYFYTFAGQPIRCGMLTAMTDAGVPMYTKTTEYRTAVCTFRTMPGSRFTIYVSMDHEAFLASSVVDMSSLDFEDMDFASLVFGVKRSDTVSLRRQERRWLRKQYQVYSDGFMRPFGLHSIAYAYHLHGKVRNK